MKAQLKEIYSSDIQTELQFFKPNNTSNFGINIRMIIGPYGSDGEESFDFILCTNEWIESNYSNIGFVDLRHHLLTSKFEFNKLYSFLINLIANTTGDSWDELANKLSRFAKWEFEDYID